jgi:hypothetical protein
MKAESVSAPLLSAVLAIENELAETLTRVQARLTALRVVISRLGEADAWACWNSAIWTRGQLVMSPVFAETWPRQRLILAIAAASAAEASHFAPEATSKPRLFLVDPSFDAILGRKLSLLSIGSCARVCAIVDGLDWSQIADLRPLGALSPIRGDVPEFDDIVNDFANDLATTSSGKLWAQQLE